MSQVFDCGLVVGKFCPLHLGHELLIRQAQTACREVLVISYTKPGFPGYGSERREAWLQARFPELTIRVIDESRLASLCQESNIIDIPELPTDDAPDDVHRNFVAWLCRDVLRKKVDRVFTSESYGDGFAGVLSQYFGRHVTHICVDQARVTIPVSGTAIRANPLAHREFLSPEVYASFIPRVCLLGGESSGKTTLAADLAKALQTTWVAEYGRTLWEARQGRLEFQDMLHIGRTQVSQENELARLANHVLICDTSPLTTTFYSQELFGKVEDELTRLAARRYDLILLCAPDFAFVQDGTRQDHAFRFRQHLWYIEIMRQRRWNHHDMVGSPEQRLANGIALIKQMLLSA